MRRDADRSQLERFAIRVLISNWRTTQKDVEIAWQAIERNKSRELDMPNGGGIIPSCFICKWAKEAEYEFMIQCQLHDFSVILPVSHVCKNLEKDWPAFTENLDGGYIYTWLEHSYPTLETSTNSQYFGRQINKLASFQEYSKWTIQEKVKALYKAEQEFSNSQDEKK